jgi:hypothetical protein
MVFRQYHASIKVATVQMTLQNHSRDFIRESLGQTISRQSFDRWLTLFNETQRVVQDPKEYDSRGRLRLLSNEDCEFMIDLVRLEPGLFLDEMRERLFDSSGTLLGISTLQRNLVDNLRITLKKADTVNSRKSLQLKFQFIADMANVPAEFLVFTG